MDRESVQYRWVLAQYPYNTEQGKKVLAAANKRSHYVLVNRMRGKTDPIIVGFKYVGEDIPDHLTVATPNQVEKLEKMK